MERATRPPEPPLSDGIVTLRQWRVADVRPLVSIFNNDAELVYWLDRLPQPYTEDDAREYIAKAKRGWREKELHTPLAVIDTATGELLGACGIFWHSSEQGVAEIGYWTRREARGRGRATRAVRLLAQWVLGDLEFERLELQADTRNGPSLLVAERAGFTKEGVIRSARANARDGRRVDHALFSLLRSELAESHWVRGSGAQPL